jgi:hypothetical protein
MRKAIELYIVTQTTGAQLVHWLRARCVFKMCVDSVLQRDRALYRNII